MNPTQSAPGACHNCRRRRWKCDRSIPKCLKCIKRGQECQGYQQLFRWEKGIASRGKMAGMTFGKMAIHKVKCKSLVPQLSSSAGPSSLRSPSGSSEASPLGSCLMDPLIQDLNPSSRSYLSYFAQNVCKDLVLYDSPRHNPFRDLIPLTHKHPVLLHIIVANSALHMSNAFQKFIVLGTTTPPLRRCTGQSDSPCPSSSGIILSKPYNDALMAKQRALSLLKSILAEVPSVDVDVTLAVVLLFTEFELIDSGRDTWRHHINGARRIIETFCTPKTTSKTIMSPLRSCLVSNCLVFDILGSTLACSTPQVSDDIISTGTQSLLQDAEGNHCSSFPAILLQLMRSGAQLFNSSKLCPSFRQLNDHKLQQAMALLQKAESFDPLVWATELQPRSPAIDLLHRTHVACAHRAAVCIYLSRVLFSLSPTVQPSHDLESHIADIITHLTFIRPSDALFTATTWPAFVAGAETDDCARQDWIAKRFQELWEVEPWGIIRGAFGVLERIWLKGRCDIVVVGEESLHQRNKRVGDWIADLRKSGVDWLII